MLLIHYQTSVAVVSEADWNQAEEKEQRCLISGQISHLIKQALGFDWTEKLALMRQSKPLQFDRRTRNYALVSISSICGFKRTLIICISVPCAQKKRLFPNTRLEKWLTPCKPSHVCGLLALAKRCVFTYVYVCVCVSRVCRWGLILSEPHPKLSALIKEVLLVLRHWRGKNNLQRRQPEKQKGWDQIPTWVQVFGSPEILFDA